MSHRQNRAPKSPKRRGPRRLRRIAAGLSLAAATTVGTALIDDLTTTVQDTAWGAPAPDTAPVTLLDTAWGA